MAKTDSEFSIIRVPVHTVIVQRNGKQVIPQIEKAFAFSQAEIDDIEAANKGSLRQPVNENAASVAEPLDANFVASQGTNREPPRDTRTKAQKEADAKAEKEAKAKVEKDAKAKTGKGSDADAEI